MKGYNRHVRARSEGSGSCTVLVHVGGGVGVEIGRRIIDDGDSRRNEDNASPYEYVIRSSSFARNRAAE